MDDNYNTQTVLNACGNFTELSNVTYIENQMLGDLTPELYVRVIAYGSSSNKEVYIDIKNKYTGGEIYSYRYQLAWETTGDIIVERFRKAIKFFKEVCNDNRNQVRVRDSRENCESSRRYR